MKYVNPLILDVFTSIPLNLWYPLIWWNSHLIFWHPFQNWLKFSFPHFIQDLIRLWCWLGAQELISNRLFRHAQIRLAELQNSSCMLSLADRSFPRVCLIYLWPRPQHTCSSSLLTRNTHSASLTGRCHKLSAQICFSWLLVARELTREPLRSKWCDKW